MNSHTYDAAATQLSATVGNSRQYSSLVGVVSSTSDTGQNRPTLSHNFIARQICLGNCRISIRKQSPNKHGL